MDESRKAENIANEATTVVALAAISETLTDEVKKSGVTVPPGEKHGDTARAAKVDDPLAEPRGGMYAKNIGLTGSPKTALELLAVLGACRTEVAMGNNATKHTDKSNESTVEIVKNSKSINHYEPVLCVVVSLVESKEKECETLLPEVETVVLKIVDSTKDVK